MPNKHRRIKVAITMGDPSGIGPEVTMGALRRLRNAFDCTVIGDARVLKRVCGCAGGLRAPVIDCHNVDSSRFRFGQAAARFGKASVEYLDVGMRMLADKQVDCLVTAPISKQAIAEAGYRYSGHTEYFMERSGVRFVVMMLLNDTMKLSLVTRHIPLASVPKALTPDALRQTIRMTDACMREFFGIAHPRIVVLGLNPHASDNGLIGTEELSIVKPVVLSMKKTVKGLAGPLPADSALLRVQQKQFDCAVVLYHDQALIPLKLTGYASGVNLTAGLPFVRTSPLHGTAFDIAGKNKADCSSMIAAITQAVRCTQRLYQYQRPCRGQSKKILRPAFSS